MNRSRLLAGLLAAALAAPAMGADEPGVFKIPGTESTIKFYGYVQLDSTLDFTGRPNGIENSDWATILPAVPANASNYRKNAPVQLYFTARTSRFGIQTSTPTNYGPITVKLEGDFNAPNAFQGETFTNSVIFRLRQAYGSFGGFLAGQTWSTFLDLAAYPDVVDFNSPGTIALVRNPMIRYTFGIAPGTTLAIAAENAAASRFGATGVGLPGSPVPPTAAGVADPFKFQTIPDIVANLGFTGGWGSLSVRGVLQTYNYVGSINPVVGNPPFSTKRTKESLSGAISGAFKVGGDTLVAQFVGGPGVGRYVFNALGEPFVSTNANNDLELWTMYGVHAGYTHVWNKMFRSNLVFAYSWFTDPKIDGIETPAGSVNAPNQKTYIQGFLNSFWTFAKNAELGVEYAIGQWSTFTGQGSSAIQGTQNRINATLHYNFY